MSNLKNVALNVSRLSVPHLINRGRQISDAIAANPGVFTNPNPSIAVINSALNDLEFAWNEAADNAKSKIAMMHAKRKVVIKHFKLLASYVEFLADGDEQIVALATLTFKSRPDFFKEDFEVFLPDDPGAVGLRCKAVKKVFYRWEYCQDPITQFQTANLTTVSNSFIGNLQSGVKYWFRVVIVTVTGEQVLGPKYAIPL